MNAVNLTEARKRLSALVQAAERGESIVITRRGKQVARIAPVEGKRRRGMPDLSEFRASIRMKGRTLTEELLAMRGA